MGRGSPVSYERERGRVSRPPAPDWIVLAMAECRIAGAGKPGTEADQRRSVPITPLLAGNPPPPATHRNHNQTQATEHNSYQYRSVSPSICAFLLEQLNLLLHIAGMERTELKITTTVTLPPDLRDQLDAEAARQDRSRSWITSKAVAEYLARRAAENPNGR